MSEDVEFLWDGARRAYIRASPNMQLVINVLVLKIYLYSASTKTFIDISKQTDTKMLVVFEQIYSCSANLFIVHVNLPKSPTKDS